MKRSPLLLLLPVLFAAGAAQAANPPPPPQTTTRAPLPLAQCIDTNNINEWNIVDDTTLTVRTGPKRYLVKTTAKCPQLGRHGPGIRFRASNDKQVTIPGRICGDVGEAVMSRMQPPCAVQSVQRIDKAQFDALKQHALRSGSGAEQPRS